MIDAERPALPAHHPAVRQLLGGGVDTAQQQIALTQAQVVGGGLASHGEHHPSRDSGDDAGRLVVIGHPGPRRRLGQVMPTGPSQPQQGDVLGLAGLEGVPVHRRGEGVGGINHRSDVLGAQEGAQPVHPAETADPHLAGDSGRCRGASGDGGDDVHLLLDEPGGQFPGQTGTSQNQDVHVVHLPSIHDWPWLDWPQHNLARLD